MIADGRYKYVRTLEPNEPEELYDLQTDPEELTNLAFDSKHAKTLARLRDAAIAELKRTDAKLVNSLPPVSTAGR
jgi:arylsulfatase A-like enzyme